MLGFVAIAFLVLIDLLKTFLFNIKYSVQFKGYELIFIVFHQNIFYAEVEKFAIKEKSKKEVKLEVLNVCFSSEKNRHVLCT